MRAVYALLVELEEMKKVEIGALGDLELDPGIYVYAGSAMNSVEKRLGRHLSGEKKLHWHIDYLLEEAVAVDYLVIPEGSEFECELASLLSRIGEPVDGFGCSDCSCASHLFRVD